MTQNTDKFEEKNRGLKKIFVGKLMLIRGTYQAIANGEKYLPVAYRQVLFYIRHALGSKMQVFRENLIYVYM